MRPDARKGKPPTPSSVQPAAMSSSESGAIGRSPRRAAPTNVASAPQGAGDGQHEAQGGARFAAVERGTGERAQQAVLQALGGGVDLVAALDERDARAQGGQAADGGVDVRARGVARHARHAVGEGRRDDDAVRHRLGCDGRYGAGERLGVDAGEHRSSLRARIRVGVRVRRGRRGRFGRPLRRGARVQASPTSGCGGTPRSAWGASAAAPMPRGTTRSMVSPERFLS